MYVCKYRDGGVGGLDGRRWPKRKVPLPRIPEGVAPCRRGFPRLRGTGTFPRDTREDRIPSAEQPRSRHEDLPSISPRLFRLQPLADVIGRQSVFIEIFEKQFSETFEYYTNCLPTHLLTARIPSSVTQQRESSRNILYSNSTRYQGKTDESTVGLQQILPVSFYPRSSDKVI